MTEFSNYAAFVGIDWADQKHAVCVQADGVCQQGSVDQRAEDLDAWAAELRQRFGGRAVAVCLEQARGALLYALLKYEFLVLFPINPKQSSSFREVFFPSGAKDDPLDADLLCRLVAQHHQHLRPWKPDDEATRRLRLLSENRRQFVDQRTALGNKLRQRLKEFFPLALELAGDDLYAVWFLRLLAKFPSHQQLRRASPQALARLLPKRRRVADDESQDPRLTRIRNAAVLVTDPPVVDTGRLAVQQLASLIGQLNQTIAQYDRELATCFAEHPEASLIQSFPAAGATMAPRLAAALGTDRARFGKAEELQQMSGVAPVQVRSGKSCNVRSRKACPRFLRQTFHEYADHSRKRSLWAQAYYRMLRDRGMRHNAAVRALAFKWIRVLFRCWKNHALYDEELHLRQLRLKNPALLRYLDPPKMSEVS